jgi:hypothetical protein
MSDDISNDRDERKPGEIGDRKEKPLRVCRNGSPVLLFVRDTTSARIVVAIHENSARSDRRC